jgi:hypothetical protein
MSPGGGTEAVNLESGASLWHVAELDKPILAADGWLLGQRLQAPGKLSLALLNVDGEQPSERWIASFALPAGVEASLDDGEKSLFEVRACARGAEIGVVWTFGRLSGPVLEAGAPDGERTTGSLIVALDSGQLRESPEPACEPRRAPAPAGAMPEPGSLTPAGATVRYASADGQYYLASRPLSAAAGDQGAGYEWEIHSAASGDPIARFKHPDPADGFVVRGALLIHDVPPAAAAAHGGVGAGSTFASPKLRALALASGTEVWSREYRDTGYRGTPAP